MPIPTNWSISNDADNHSSTLSHVELTFAISELQELLGEMVAFRNVVHSMPYLFSRSGAIKPIECDHLTKALIQVRTMVEKVIVLMKPEKAFSALGSYNYQLLLRLHYSVDKIVILLELAGELRSICHQESPESARVLVKLQMELSRLLHENEKIEHDIGSELDLLLLEANP